MKEHVLNPSDRAALQGLIPLAGALGAGTIFALFFGGRRRGSGIAVFELFAIVAVLTAVATTAYFCIALLHRNQPISDRELTETATPLIVAVFLLVFVSVGARLPGSAERIFAILPLALVGAVAAAWLASSAWTADPGDANWIAALILGVGALAALVAWGADRLNDRWDRSTEQRRFIRLSVAGYRVTEKELQLVVPGAKRGAAPVLSCWVRKEKVYLDSVACRRLRDLASARWERLAEGKGTPPVGAYVLIRVQVSRHVPGLNEGRSARLWVFEPGAGREPRVRDLKANDDGLFDVTELGVVQL